MRGGDSVTGFKELERNLERLSKAAGKGVLRRSLKKSAEPMVEVMKSLVAVSDGDLRDSMTASTGLSKRQSGLHRRLFRDERASVELFVGPSYNLGAGGRHGHLVEFGTAQMAPQPFMRPAWDQDHKAMLERLSATLWVELEKSLQRAARKAAKG